MAETHRKAAKGAELLGDGSSSCQGHVASITQLPSEVLHHIWSMLPPSTCEHLPFTHTASKAAWRATCKAFCSSVSANATRLTWRGETSCPGNDMLATLLPKLCSTTASPPSCAAHGSDPATNNIRDGASCSSSSGASAAPSSNGGGRLALLNVSHLHLAELHEQAFAAAGSRSQLLALRTLICQSDASHSPPCIAALRALLSHCHPTTLDLSFFSTSQLLSPDAPLPSFTAFPLLAALPAPSPSLPGYPGLLHLRLRSWHMTQDAATALAAALRSNLTALVELDLFDCSTQAEELPALAGVVSAALSSGSLQVLRLSDTDWDQVSHFSRFEEQEGIVADVLCGHACRLTVLDAYWQQVKAEHVLPVLKHNAAHGTLRELRLSAVALTEAEAVTLASQLARLTGLGELWLMYDHIANNLQALLPALQQLTGLHTLHFQTFNSNVFAWEGFAAAVARMPLLRSFTLGTSRIMSGTQLTQLWEACPARLTRLCFRRVAVSSVSDPFAFSTGAASALQRLSQLCELDLLNLQLPGVTGRAAVLGCAIAQALTHMPALRRLRFSIHGRVPDLLTREGMTVSLYAIVSAVPQQPGGALRQLELPWHWLPYNELQYARSQLRQRAPLLKLERCPEGAELLEALEFDVGVLDEPPESDDVDFDPWEWDAGLDEEGMPEDDGAISDEAAPEDPPEEAGVEVLPYEYDVNDADVEYVGPEYVEYEGEPEDEVSVGDIPYEYWDQLF